MSATVSNMPTVRIFAPDGDDGYIEWSNLSESDKRNTRERVMKTVRRSYEIRRSDVASEVHRAEVSRQVRELIGWLSEDA